ncbi:hypothetical protein [Burkholderia vietnamiensis]|uniref:hypothetical protein n=1 Tax=Burkholderia vietnamiensis TaxID=60552 RepID=UPI0012D9FA1C|nr:hypothetical protein [Burkholderia vietnamiensis]MCA8291838.1 hypothetical protein [Burkholderia vietnamiensis]
MRLIIGSSNPLLLRKARVLRCARAFALRRSLFPASIATATVLRRLSRLSSFDVFERELPPFDLTFSAVVFVKRGIQ